MSDIMYILQWLVSEDLEAADMVNTHYVLWTALALFALSGAMLFSMAWRQKVRRDEITRQMVEHERTVNRIRRI